MKKEKGHRMIGTKQMERLAREIRPVASQQPNVEEYGEAHRMTGKKQTAAHLILPDNTVRCATSVST